MVWLIAGIGCFFASLGFGILFHIKGKSLIYASISGAIGGMIYHLILEISHNEILAMFCASFSFSLYSELMARLCHSPVTTFIIPGLIPLVPGGGMYEMMVHAVEGNASLLMEKGLQTLSIAGVLVLGLICASALFKMLQMIRREYACNK